MKLYVINLDRSSARLRRVEDAFQQQGLTLTRIAAVDAKAVSDTLYAKYANATGKTCWPEPMTRGEVACFLSHRLALHHIAQGGDDYGAVFEDDITLSSHARIFLDNASWIPCGADIVKIETQGKKIWLGPPLSMAHGFCLSRLKSEHILAAAYIVSKQAAAFLVEKMEYVCAPFDHFLFNFDYGIASDLRIYQLDPAIAMQIDPVSTLEDGRAQNISERRKKQHLIQILNREILRIGIRSCTSLRGFKINLFTREQWKRVSFDQAE